MEQNYKSQNCEREYKLLYVIFIYMQYTVSALYTFVDIFLQVYIRRTKAKSKNSHNILYKFP